MVVDKFFIITQSFEDCDDLICHNLQIDRTYHNTLESHKNIPII